MPFKDKPEHRRSAEDDSDSADRLRREASGGPRVPDTPAARVVNEGGRVTRVEYPNGKTREFQYDSQGQVTEVKEPDGSVWKRQADGNFHHYKDGVDIGYRRGDVLVKSNGEYVHTAKGSGDQASAGEGKRADRTTVTEKTDGSRLRKEGEDVRAIVYPDGTTRRFERDSQGEITEVKNRDGSLWKKEDDGKWHQYKDGNKTGETWQGRVTVDAEGNYVAYNKDGTRSTERTDGVKVTVGENNQVRKIEYPDGRVDDYSGAPRSTQPSQPAVTPSAPAKVSEGFDRSRSGASGERRAESPEQGMAIPTSDTHPGKRTEGAMFADMRPSSTASERPTTGIQAPERTAPLRLYPEGPGRDHTPSALSASSIDLPSKASEQRIPSQASDNPMPARKNVESWLGVPPSGDRFQFSPVFADGNERNAKPGGAHRNEEHSPRPSAGNTDTRSDDRQAPLAPPLKETQASHVGESASRRATSQMQEAEAAPARKLVPDSRIHVDRPFNHPTAGEPSTLEHHQTHPLKSETPPATQHLIRDLQSGHKDRLPRAGATEVEYRHKPLDDEEERIRRLYPVAPGHPPVASREQSSPGSTFPLSRAYGKGNFERVAAGLDVDVESVSRIKALAQKVESGSMLRPLDAKTACALRVCDMSLKRSTSELPAVLFLKHDPRPNGKGFTDGTVMRSARPLTDALLVDRILRAPIQRTPDGRLPSSTAGNAGGVRRDLDFSGGKTVNSASRQGHDTPRAGGRMNNDVGLSGQTGVRSSRDGAGTIESRGPRINFAGGLGDIRTGLTDPLGRPIRRFDPLDAGCRRYLTGTELVIAALIATGGVARANRGRPDQQGLKGDNQAPASRVARRPDSVPVRGQFDPQSLTGASVGIDGPSRPRPHTLAIHDSMATGDKRVAPPGFIRDDRTGATGHLSWAVRNGFDAHDPQTRRYLPGTEVALAALYIASGIARGDRQARADGFSGNDRVDPPALAESDNQRIGAAGGGDRTDNARPARKVADPEALAPAIKPVLRRPSHLVAADDDLVELAEHLYNDANLAWLIADLNLAWLSESWVDGKRIIELRSRQKIDLPVQQDINEFYRMRTPEMKPENLITVVAESQMDKELADSRLRAAMGLASAVSDPFAQPAMIGNPPTFIPALSLTTSLTPAATLKRILQVGARLSTYVSAGASALSLSLLGVNKAPDVVP